MSLQTSGAHLDQMKKARRKRYDACDELELLM